MLAFPNFWDFNHSVVTVWVWVSYSYIVLGGQLYNDPDQKIIASFGRKCLPFRRRTRSLTPLDNPVLAPTSERLISSLAQLSEYLTGTIVFLAAILQFLAIFRPSDIWYSTQLLSEPGSYGVLKIREMLGSVLAWKGWVRFPCPASSTCHLPFEKVLIRLLNHSDANVLQVVLCCWELTCFITERHSSKCLRNGNTAKAASCHLFKQQTGQHCL